MTVQNDVVLWNSGKDKLSVLKVSPEQQYRYIDGFPCVTFGIAYESADYKGYDVFTVFDHFYADCIGAIEGTYRTLNGSFRIYDIGADTDGYIDFKMENGCLLVKGQLGATFASHCLRFAFEADQTLVGALLHALTV